MENLEECRLETVAVSGAGRVDRCQHCGCVSLHMGPLTVRLEETGLGALHELLGAATLQLLRAQPALPRHRLPQ